jgi:hypothetical protein
VDLCVLYELLSLKNLEIHQRRRHAACARPKGGHVPVYKMCSLVLMYIECVLFVHVPKVGMSLYIECVLLC